MCLFFGGIKQVDASNSGPQISIKSWLVSQNSTYNSSRCRCDNTIFMIRCGLDSNGVSSLQLHYLELRNESSSGSQGFFSMELVKLVSDW
jgi:hypothetical protein